jgi:hypothetical protein
MAMQSPRHWLAHWVRPNRHRGIDLAVESTRIWTTSYERELNRWCKKLRGATDSTTGNILDVRINADRDDDLARIWQIATVRLDRIGADAARCDRRANAARAKAIALASQVRTAEQQLHEVDHQLAVRRDLALFEEPGRPLTKQQRA